jgi:hypothetical protein
MKPALVGNRSSFGCNAQFLDDTCHDFPR